MTQTYAEGSPTTRDRQVVKALRFGLVGAVGVAVNLVGLDLFYRVVGLPIVVASTAAVELAIVHNYLVNDWWTFRRPRPALSRFLRYNCGALLTMVVNVAIVWVLVTAGVGYVAANLVAIACAAGLNFGVSSAWVWRDAPR